MWFTSYVVAFHRNRVRAAISHVAMAFDDRAELQQRAEAAAGNLNPSDIRLVAALLNASGRTPTQFESTHKGLGDWIWAWLIATVEILFYCGEPAFDLVKQIAFGACDWAQPVALDVLCRWAKMGIRRDEIALRIANELKCLCTESLMPCIRSLAKMGPLAGPDVANALENLFLRWHEENEDPADLLAILEAQAEIAPELAREHVDFIRHLGSSDVFAHRNPLIDGAVCTVSPDGAVVAAEESFPSAAERERFHRTRALNLLARLFPP